MRTRDRQYRPRSSADSAADAEITDADLLDAARQWRMDAPPALRNLLDVPRSDPRLPEE